MYYKLWIEKEIVKEENRDNERIRAVHFNNCRDGF